MLLKYLYKVNLHKNKSTIFQIERNINYEIMDIYR